MSRPREQATASASSADETARNDFSGSGGMDGDARGSAVTFAEARAELARTRAALATSMLDLQLATRRIVELERMNESRQFELRHLVQREAQARVFGHYDELTGLANRRLLKDRLRQAMAQATRKNLSIALVLLDLDDFKRINDELGHPVGDRVLQIVAARLIAATRGADTPCRYGGDEFVVMLPQVDDGDMASAVADKLRTSITAPIGVANREIRLTASAGCVLYPKDATTCAGLIDVADQRLYRAKAHRTPVAISAVPNRMRGH